MPDVVNIGVNAQDVQKSEMLPPYSKVIVNVDDDTFYEVGNDSGQILEVTIPWGTQEIAENLLASMLGTQYQPYNVTNATVDPSVEIGDAVTTNSVYGGMYQQDITFGRTMYSNFSAPQDEQLDNEYKYETSTERRITRQGAWAKTEFTIVDGKIATEVSERQADSQEFRTGIAETSQAITLEAESRSTEDTRLQGQIDVQAGQISAKVSQTGGESSSFGWSLISTGFTLYSGSKTVFSCNSTGISVDGQITARSGYIGNGSNGFEIGNTYIRNGMTSRDDTEHNGVYIGTDGIATGKGNFKVDNQGNVTAKGTIHAKSGYIGNDSSGFTIGNTNIRNGMESLSDVTHEGVYLGVDGIALGKGAFKVTKVGKLIASDAEITGKLTANTGKLGSNGFTIDTKAIYNGMTSLSDTTNNGVYVGTDGIALGKGNFKVTSGGALTAKSGYIGNGSSGFSIGNTSISNGMTSLSDTTNDGVYIGTDGIALGKGVFKVTKAGKLTASDVEITGKITANSGGIGSNGFTIGTKSIYNGMTSVDDTTNNGVYVGTDGIALGKGNFKVTSSGSLTAKSGYIGNGSNGFSIGNTSIANGMTSLSDTTNQGVYIGTDGIALGKGVFKVTKAGKLTASDVEITGKITANSGGIGSNGFTIGTNAIYKGMTSVDDTTNNGVYVGTDGIALGKGNFKVTSGGALTAKSGDIAGWSIGTSSLSKLNKSGSTVTSHVGMSSSGSIAFYAGQSESSANCAFKVYNTGRVYLTDLFARTVDTSAPGYNEDDPSTWTWIDSQVDLGTNAYKIGSGYNTIAGYDSTTGKVRLSDGRSFNTATSVKLAGGWSGASYAFRAYYNNSSGAEVVVARGTSDIVGSGFMMTPGGSGGDPHYYSWAFASLQSGASELSKTEYKLGFSSSSYSASTSVQVQNASGGRISDTATLSLTNFWNAGRNAVGINNGSWGNNNGVLTVSTTNRPTNLSSVFNLDVKSTGDSSDSSLGDTYAIIPVAMYEEDDDGNQTTRLSKNLTVNCNSVYEKGRAAGGSIVKDDIQIGANNTSNKYWYDEGESLPSYDAALNTLGSQIVKNKRGYAYFKVTVKGTTKVYRIPINTY